MKKNVWIIFVFIFAVSLGTGYGASVDIQTGLKFNWWDSDAGNRGTQTYAPVTISAEYSDFSMKLLTSFAHTEADTSDGFDNSLSCVVDTKINFSYAIVDRFPADILLGLDFNLPTGKTKLDTDEIELAIDPDLVFISQYGEGFNANPTLSLAKVWNSWAAGIGIGYLFRGKYDYSEDVQDFKPGNIFNVTGEVDYFFSSRWKGKIFGEYALYETDQVDSKDFYKESDFSLVGIGVNFYETAWDAEFTLQGIFRGKSSFEEDGIGLRTEERSSYGDEWIADLNWRYSISKKTTLRSRLHYLYVAENDYTPDSPFFIDQRQKVSLAVGISRQFLPLLKAELDFSGYVLDVGRNWYNDNDLTYHGFTTSVLLTKKF